MTKIKPINKIGNTIKPLIKTATKPNTTHMHPSKLAYLPAVGIPLALIQNENFHKTINEDNYFQLKINPETGKPYSADIFQKAAAANIHLGNDVLVTAPTGTGKTAIALYAITNNLKEGKKTFYTTPLKALSNEKFKDFCKIFGEENVGLITGDSKINTNAPVIIMTTEVYRNMAAGGIFNQNTNKGLPKDLKTVIFDELQYLGDVDRGGIWEQSIMFTPKNVQMLSLSATIGNNININSWMGKSRGQNAIVTTPNEKYTPHQSPVKETVLINVPSENRHVPLDYEIMKVVSDVKLPKFATNKEKEKAKQKASEMSRSIYAKPREESYKKVTEKLLAEDKLPAIYFVFSKKESRKILRYLAKDSKTLTTPESRHEIAQIIKKYKEDGIYLGESLNTEALMKGYAVHNSGLLPSQKGLIEELFQKKLIKVVIATETLSAGINMPARTTVISSPRKPSSTSDGGMDKKRNLSANELHQMGGRAGRRGIDTQGYCILLSCNPEQYNLYQDLVATPASKLDSNLDLDFSFIANYLSNLSNENDLKYILKKSFFSYKENKGYDEEKLEKLFDNIQLKKNLLIKKGFIKPDGGMTKKGNLIKMLNGYEQIPIIEIISNKMLKDLSPVQLAGILGGLANIEYNTRGDDINRPFELEFVNNEQFKDSAEKVADIIKTYGEDLKTIYPAKDAHINSNIMEHLYSWAELNSFNEDSKENWKKLYTGDLKTSIKDEGSLFREIATTIDLIKQLAHIAKEGEAQSKKPEDIAYYQNLRENLQQALKLLLKQPVDMQY